MSETSLIQRVQARVGTILRGKYRLESVIGVGGIGAVYAATHRNTKRFAVKMLHADLSPNDDIRNRFLREGYAANRVCHPGTVAVLDDDVTEDGVAFIVMELLEGVAVDVHAARCGGRLSVKSSVAIIDQLLDVLAAAHAARIIHRDIKPANLFVTTDGRLKVLDFGIARARDALALGNGTATITGRLLGTPAFMAPEQARAQSSEVCEQTDLWATAATFFTLVTGELIHEGDNAALILFHAATRAARPLTSVQQAVPNSIAAVVDRGLAFARQDRWPSAVEMRNALRNAYSADLGPFPERVMLDELPDPVTLDEEPTASPEAEHFQPADVANAPPSDAALSDALTSRLPRPDVSGSVTTEPVESASRGRITRRRSRRWPFLVGLGLLTLAAGAAWAGFHFASGPPAATARLPPEGASTPLRPSTTPALDVTGRPAAGSPSAGEAPSTEGTPLVDPHGARSVATAPEGEPVDRTGAVDSGGNVAVTDRPRVHPVQMRPATPPAHCNPPYSFDSEGNRVFLKECL